MNILQRIHKPILLAILAATAALAPASFTRLTDLGAGGFAQDINAKGTIVGAVSDPQTHGLIPAVWEAGALKTLPVGGFGTAAVSAISENGILVGIANIGYNQTAVTWVNDQIVALPDLGEGGTALDVNSAGQIVGYVNSGDEFLPATWTNGQLSVLPLPAFGEAGDKLYASANSINENGQIVGMVKVAFGSDKLALMWVGDVVKPLPLDGAHQFLETVGVHVTSDGHVLFAGYKGPNAEYGIHILNTDLSVTTLGRVEGAIASYPLSLTDNGVTIGYSHFFDQAAGVVMLVPTVWRDGTPTTLELEDGYRWGLPLGANDAGQIVGSISDGVSGTSVAGVWSNDESYPLTISSEKGFPGTVVTFTGTIIENGKPLAGKEVRFQMLTGEIGRATTNKKGIAKLRYTIPGDMSVGSHPVMGSFGGGKYAQSKLVVEAAPTVLTAISVSGKAGARVSVKGTLSNKANGKSLSAQAINATSGTAKMSTRTKQAGDYAFQLDIPAKAKPGTKYTMTVRFDGKPGFQASSAKATITVQ